MWKTTSTLNLAAALQDTRVLMINNDHQGNLTAVGLTPAKQKYMLANLLLAAIDYPEDIELHLTRTVLPIKDGLDLILANKRLMNVAARFQVMKISKYNSVRNADRCYENMMAELLSFLKNSYY